jgi:hypothetical protein
MHQITPQMVSKHLLKKKILGYFNTVIEPRIEEPSPSKGKLF